MAGKTCRNSNPLLPRQPGRPAEDDWLHPREGIEPCADIPGNNRDNILFSIQGMDGSYKFRRWFKRCFDSCLFSTLLEGSVAILLRSSLPSIIILSGWKTFGMFRIL
jgi:hypothetical protein